MKKLLVSILLIALPTTIFACDSAYLFKVFPIGMCGDTIISIDINIFRGFNPNLKIDHTFQGSITFNNKSISETLSETKWYLKSYITKYDEKQNPIEITPIDSVILRGNYCNEELQIIYEKAYKKIISEYKGIELFKTKDFYFGNFEEKYKDLEIKDKQFIYKKQAYPIQIANDSTYYGIEKSEYLGLFIPPMIGTVRRYTLNDIELIVVHAQIGQILGGDKKKPKVKFKHVSEAAYIDPILYHGNGIDYFFIRRKTI